MGRSPLQWLAWSAHAEQHPILICSAFQLTRGDHQIGGDKFIAAGGRSSGACLRPAGRSGLGGQLRGGAAKLTAGGPSRWQLNLQRHRSAR